MTVADVGSHQLLVVGSYLGQIVIYNMEDGNKQFEIGGHTKLISALFFDKETNRLYSGSEDTSVCVWQIQEN